MSPFPDYVHIFCFQNYASILKKSEHIIRYFSVRNSMIPRLDDHLFMGMKIEHLYIHDCSKYSFSLNQRQITLRIMDYHFSSRLTANLNLCLIHLKLLVHVLKQFGQCSCDFEVNRTKIKGSCQSGRKVVTHDSKSDLPLVYLLAQQMPRPAKMIQ